MENRVFAVLMAGGSGTRFWPLSRRNRPKQILPIVDERPMIRGIVDRLAGLVPTDRVLVVTGADQADAVREALPDVPAGNVLLEPAPRNTAPCIGLAAVTAAARDPGALLLCLPADHVIEPEEEFRATCRLALDRADRAGTLLTFGVRATRPATGYGYILVGEETAPGIHGVGEFIEKPSAEKAEGLLAKGGYAWNSGMFAWRADAYLSEVRAHLPKLADGLDLIAADPASIDEVFPRLPAESVDYGVMEPTNLAEVVPADFTWDDVGSFEALSRLVAANESGNHARGEIISLCSSGLVTYAAPGHTVAALGVEDLVIVATPDVTLVCPRSKAEKVKELVEQVRRVGRAELT